MCLPITYISILSNAHFTAQALTGAMATGSGNPEDVHARLPHLHHQDQDQAGVRKAQIRPATEDGGRPPLSLALRVAGTLHLGKRGMESGARRSTG